jgi:hypothetical protein
MAELSSQLRELTTDALSYWEIRRIFYNLILAFIVVVHFIANYPGSKGAITIDGLLGLFLLAVIANIAFTAVYLPDVFIQFSGFRESRSSWRIALLVVGFAFAAVITHLISSNLFVVKHPVVFN